MNFRKALLVVCTMLATIPTSYARKVEIKSFGPEASEFHLLEPGRSQKPVETAQPNTSVALDSEFASHARTLDPATTGMGNPANLRVPSWMRAKTSAFEHNGVPSPTTSLSGCGPLRYAPHPALNAVQETRRRRHFVQMATAACGAGVPVELFDALIIQESRYNPLALSSKGASGLAQLMPGTARALGVLDRWSVAQNLEGGAQYLRKQLDTFGNWALALGAYNAGPGNVTKYGGLPPFRETRGYVRTILASINSYQRSQSRIDRVGPQPRRNVTLALFTQ
jgi:hypothetical protein